MQRHMRLFSTVSKLQNTIGSASASCSARFPPNPEHLNQATTLKHLHFRGLTPYNVAGRLQDDIVNKHLQFKVENNNSRVIAPLYPALLTFEMQSVYTGGKRERKSNKATKIPMMETDTTDGNIMTKIGVPYVQTDRGGQVTYHGPGQLVGYFVWDLRLWRNLTSKCFVNFVEQVSLETVRSAGVDDACTTTNTGVWVNKNHGCAISDTPNDVEKISSIGLNLRRNVTSHGVSINLNPELRYLNNPEFVMCGLNGYHQTSIYNELADGMDQSLDVTTLGELLEKSITSRMNNYMINEPGKEDWALRVEKHTFDTIPQDHSEILDILALH